MNPRCHPLLFALIVAAAVACPSAARGQGIGGYPAGVQVGGGLIVPLGASAGAVNPGWDVAVAGDVEFRPGMAIRLDYLYGRFGAEDRTLADAAVLHAKTQMHLVTLDLAWRSELSDRGTFYVFGGGAVAVRRVVLTDTGDGTFDEMPVDLCEPQWLQCAGEPIPYHLAQGVRESTDLGVNVGTGFSWDVGLSARLFAEARLFYIDGPTFHDSAGKPRSSDAIYAPLVAGLRFQW
ncbi:MAG: hypothetical protein H6Q10_2515 [Acidobacteria bacterium]|nr:hypothetical protein [Acidobacteriota bacterium]